jgi:hypothetical protein
MFRDGVEIIELLIKRHPLLIDEYFAAYIIAGLAVRVAFNLPDS